MSEYRTISTEEYREDWRSQRIIDPDVVVQILRHHLDDLTRFRLAALSWR